MDWYRTVVRPLLFRLEPEAAHNMTVKALSFAPPTEPPVCRPVEVAGLQFPNPIGLAAGFDKGGEAIAGAFKLGFGCVEVGTVTPKPQPGNPKPRMFRLAEHRAVINRYGFNSEGHAVVHDRIARAARPKTGILGINIGVNKDSGDPAADYVAGIEAFADVADYLTVNISSPNTPGLRDLQGRERLEALLARVRAARDDVAFRIGARRPLFLKVAPDLMEEDIVDITAAIEAQPIDALIVSNTTIGRAGVEGDLEAGEAGGLSGAPLMALSTERLATFHHYLGDSVPLIGAGGISSPADVQAKFDAGARLVQLYTGLVYGGPPLVRQLLGHLERG